MKEENKEPTIRTKYQPIIIGDETIELPVMSSTGLSKKKYLVIPNEYLNINEYILLDGVTLIPIISLKTNPNPTKNT